MLDTLLKLGRGSLTILWGRILALASIALAVTLQLADVPEVRAALQSVLPPEHLPYLTLAIAVVTLLARGRTLGKGE